MKVHEVAVLVGSLRQASITRRLAEALIARAPDNVRCTIVPIDLPLYNEDLDSNVPEQWTAFRERVAASDAVLFASPEYNRSIPGVLKNAIDVGSRPYMRGVLIGKPAAVVTQAPAPLGPTLSNHAIRQALVFLNMPVMPQPEVYLSRTRELFDAEGAIANPDTDALLTKFMAAFAQWIGRFVA